jgi:hypothetical protein
LRHQASELQFLMCVPERIGAGPEGQSQKMLEPRKVG